MGGSAPVRGVSADQGPLLHARDARHPADRPACGCAGDRGAGAVLPARAVGGRWRQRPHGDAQSHRHRDGHTEPTPIPAPTPQVYTIKAGDTLSKIAKAFGVTVDDLLAANKDTIKNKDRIVVGNQITIPVPASDEVGGEASGSPAP